MSSSTTPPQLRHPAKPPPLRIRRLNHLPIRGPTAEPEEDHHDHHHRHHRHEAPRRGADLAVVKIARHPGVSGRREGLELVAAEGVVDETEESDSVAAELQGRDLLGAEDDGEGDKENSFEDSGECED